MTHAASSSFLFPLKIALADTSSSSHTHTHTHDAPFAASRSRRRTGEESRVPAIADNRRCKYQLVGEVPPEPSLETRRARAREREKRGRCRRGEKTPTRGLLGEKKCASADLRS